MLSPNVAKRCIRVPGWLLFPREHSYFLISFLSFILLICSLAPVNMFSSISVRSAAWFALLHVAASSPFSKRQDDSWKAAIEVDFPDPSVVRSPDGNWYAYATAGNGVEIQVAFSPLGPTGGLEWQYQEGKSALEHGSISWAAEDPSIWAPDVTVRSTGEYLMAYAAVAASNGKHCIGFATSADRTYILATFPLRLSADNLSY
jgi:beta-xylosidase